jgi:hypothetical protein
MFNAEQYRAKAAEYRKRARKTDNPSEIREFENLGERSANWPTTKSGLSKIL